MVGDKAMILLLALPTASALLVPRLASTFAPTMQPRASTISMGGALIDATRLEDVADVATAMKTNIARVLDEEWIEQEDHVRVAGEAARVYVEAREAGEDDIGRLLIKIGGAMELVDMGECFIGPWDVANMAADVLMRENDPDIQSAAAGGDDSCCG